MWKEYQLLIKAIQKRYLSWQSCYINWVRGYTSARSLPCIKHFWVPPARVWAIANVQKTRRLSMKSGVVIKVNGSWKESLTKFRLTKNWSFGVWSALDVTLVSKLYWTHQFLNILFMDDFIFEARLKRAEVMFSRIGWNDHHTFMPKMIMKMLIVLVSVKLEVC